MEGSDSLVVIMCLYNLEVSDSVPWPTSTSKVLFMYMSHYQMYA